MVWTTQSSYDNLCDKIAENFGSIRVSDWGGGVCHLPKGGFFFLKIEGASGFQTPSEDSLELFL